MVCSAILSSGTSAFGQAESVRHIIVRTEHDSGLLANAQAREQVVYSEVVQVAGAPWLRLSFDEVRLGDKSHLRITSFADGEMQKLDATALAQWKNTTAYFNGSAVLLELVAGPRTTDNRVRLTRSLAGSGQGGFSDRRVCDTTDNRVPSANDRVGRLLALALPLPTCPAGLPCGTTAAGLCSAQIIDVIPDDDGDDRLLLSAGHCFDSGSNNSDASEPSVVMQFGPIPDTDAAICGLKHPPVAKQFVVNSGRLRYNNPGECGNDWSVFLCCPNSTTTKTVYEEQLASFTLAAAAPANGAALTKFGCGADGPAITRFCGCVEGQSESTKFGTQQSSMGTVTAAVGPDWVIRHNCHTCGGDSGCALVNNLGELVGLHTAGGCQPNPSPPNNCGAVITNPNLQNAINLVKTQFTPVNDLCMNARVVSDGSIAFLTKGATTDGPTDYRLTFDPTDTQASNDIWFLYHSPYVGPQNVRFSVCNSDFDTRLLIYDLACPTGPDTALAVADDSTGCSSRSELIYNTQANASYLIRVGAYGDITGSGTLEIGPAITPPGNTCNMMLRTAGEGFNFFTTHGATTDGPAEAACAGGQITQDVWWKYIPCQSGEVVIETCQVTPFDTCLAVYAFNGALAPCPRGALILASDNACGQQSRVTIPVVRGTSYLIRVGGPNQAHGTGVLAITPVVPNNNACANAQVVAEGRFLFDNRRATTDGPAITGCFAPPCVNDVWFKYTYPGLAAADLTIQTCGPLTGFDTVIVVYAANCPPMGAEVACNDDACGTQSRVLINVNAGDEFYIRVGSYNTDRAGCGVLDISYNDTGLPANDEACSALPIYEGTTAYTTVNATTDGPNPVACLPMAFNQDLEHDIWYQFITTRAGNIVVDACDATFDARLASYAIEALAGAVVCPPTNAAAACGDDDCGTDTFRPLMNIPIAVDGMGTPTSDYWIRMGGFDDGLGGGVEEGTGNLRVRVLPNDNCTAARFNSGLRDLGNGDNMFDNKGALPFNGRPADGPALGAACDAMNDLRADLWFVYHATNTGNTTFAVTASYNNFVALYDAPFICDVPAGTRLLNCPGGAPLDCNHANAAAGANKRSSLVRATIAGNLYWVRIGGFGDGEFGPGIITVTPSPAGPPNNDCANARTAELGDNPFTTVGATTDGPALAAGCTPDNQIHQDVWFTYFAPMTGNLVIETCGGPAAFDTRVAVYNSPALPACPPPPAPAPLPFTCTALVLVAGGCNDNSTDAACAPRSQLNIPITIGRAYYIRVGGVNTMTGTGTLTLRFIMNDVCVNAKQILPGGGAFPYLAATAFFNSSGANTDGAPDATCNFFANNQIGQDLWYWFSSPQKGRITIDTIGSSFDTKLAIYTAGGGMLPACPPPAPLACNDDIGGGVLQSRVARDVMGGDQILIRVGGYLAGQGPGQVNISFTDNDSCDRARNVVDGTYSFDTRGASQDGVATCGNSNTTPDVWFLYTASCDGDLIADTCGSAYDTVLSVYNDNCLMPVESACSDDDLGVVCTGLRQSRLAAPVVTGSGYLIRVSGFNGATGLGRLTLMCEAKGACCVGATCLQLRRSECVGANQAFTGPGQACNAPDDATTPCCKADFNRNGMISVQDLFDFLTAYFGNAIAADASGNSMVELQDIFDYLAAYFAGCP